VIGASAGGLPALLKIVAGLPSDLPIAAFVVVHQPPSGASVLPEVLNRLHGLHAVHPLNGAPIEAGTIYVAPNDRHLSIEHDAVRVERGPRVNRSRPAIDVLFVSAARRFRRRAVGVVLSGLLDDGALGLATIKRMGGVAIVQDPDEALFSSMPLSAIARAGDVDYVLRADEIAPVLLQLVDDPPVIEGKEPSAVTMDDGEEIVTRDFAAQEQGQRDRQPSIFTCPECGGVLWEIEEGDLLRYRCHVGHEYSMESMAEGHAEVVERALWSAVRALEESASLSRRLERRLSDDGHARSARRYGERAHEAEQQADVLRSLLEHTRFTMPADADPAGLTSSPAEGA
jgi:two-component system chemotaxis response regulator CheB